METVEISRCQWPDRLFARGPDVLAGRPSHTYYYDARVSTLRNVFEARLCQVFHYLLPPHFPVPFASPFFA